MRCLTRRQALAASVALTATRAVGETIHGAPPWRPYAGEPPAPAGPGQWHFFRPEEGAAIEAMVDRLIPPDPTPPGGRDAGCAVFIDRQLAGAYGSAASLYMRPPFREGTKSQGVQSPQTPATRYRLALADLDGHCRTGYAGKAFAQLSLATQDKLLHDLQSSALMLPHTSGAAFFEQVLKDTKQGFFADPIYGGNRDMCAWKMIGFPGAYYDYRDWVERHNQRFPSPPVGIAGAPQWQPG